MFRLLLLFSLLSLSSCADLLSTGPVDLLSGSLESPDSTGVTGVDGSIIGPVSRLESLNYCPRVQTRAGTSSYRIFTDTPIDVVAVDTTDTTDTDIVTVADTAIATTTTVATASDIVANTASDVVADTAIVVGDNLVEDLGEDIVDGLGENLSEGLGENLSDGLSEDIVAGLGEDTFGYVGEDEVEYDIADLHYQGTITRVARQCIYRGDELDITIGIRARAILGPIGSSGDITMPFRVVLRQPECLYLDEVFDSVANFSPDVSITTFRLVTDPLTIPVPDQTNVLLYVGFNNPAIETPELPICES